MRPWRAGIALACCALAACGSATTGSPSASVSTSATASAAPVAAIPSPGSCPPASITPAAKPTTAPEPSGASLVEDTLHFQAPAAPSFAVTGFGSVWVEQYRGSAVIRIDPQTDKVIATIPMPSVGFGNSGSDRLVTGPHGVWVPIFENSTSGAAPAASQLLHIDPATNAVVSHKEYPSIGAVIDGPDGLWILIDPASGDAKERRLVAIDPVSGAALRTVDLGPPRLNPTYTPEVDDFLGSLWVVIDQDTIARVNPSSGTVTATVHTPAVPSGGVVMVADASHVYVAGDDESIARVDAQSNCVDAVLYIGGAHGSSVNLGLLSAPEGLYAGFDQCCLALVDPATMTVKRSVQLTQPDQLFGSSPAEGFGAVWYPAFGEDTVLKVKPLGGS